MKFPKPFVLVLLVLALFMGNTKVMALAPPGVAIKNAELVVKNAEAIGPTTFQQKSGYLFQDYVDSPAFWIVCTILVAAGLYLLKWLLSQGLVIRTKNWWRRSGGSILGKPIPKHA